MKIYRWEMSYPKPLQGMSMTTETVEIVVLANNEFEAYELAEEKLKKYKFDIRFPDQYLEYEVIDEPSIVYARVH